MAKKKLSYPSAGVDIANADATKRAMAGSLKKSPLVLNSFGAFASLVEGRFPGYDHPVLVCKTEEPGSKQLLAFEHDRIESICEDMINHLVNDIIVMGAAPLFVQDLIICGKIESEKVKRIVAGIAAACEAQDCVLTGGETTEQPGVLAKGTYVLGASGIGVVEKSKVIDGSAIKEGDTVLAVESSGLHTNGYTLVRALLKGDPSLADAKIGGTTFLDSILTSHRCYYKTLKGLFENPGLHGMAHITGGGIPGNLNRILPKNLDADIDASAISVIPVFSFIKEKSNNDDADMIRTFNLGVGATLVVDPSAVDAVIAHVKKHGTECYPIGKIVKNGSGIVQMKGDLRW